MIKAEFLPDNINMVNIDGDVVPIDEEVLATVADEASHSENFLLAQDVIEMGIKTSTEKGYRTVKVGGKPLAQFLAVDLFTMNLTSDEITMIIDTYREHAATPLGIHKTTRRALGADATALAQYHIPDVRMMAANDDTFKD